MRRPWFVPETQGNLNLLRSAPTIFEPCSKAAVLQAGEELCLPRDCESGSLSGMKARLTDFGSRLQRLSPRTLLAVARSSTW